MSIDYHTPLGEAYTISSEGIRAFSRAGPPPHTPNPQAMYVIPEFLLRAQAFSDFQGITENICYS